MKYGEATVSKNYNNQLVDIGKGILTKLAYFFIGIVVSHGTVLEEYAPFSAAYLAAVPYGNIWAALTGCVIGSIIPSKVNGGIRYIATSLAVGAIRWALNDLKRLNRSLFFASFVAMFPIIATGIAMGTVNGFTTTTIIAIITEGLLTFAGAYFFSKTSLLLSGSKGISTFNQQELVCVAMSICILLLSFADVSIKGISLGRILSIVIILLCANNGGINAGSVAGVAGGIIFSLSSAKMQYISGAYAFGGMMAGLFSPIGGVASTLAFIFCNAATTFQTGDMSIIIIQMYELMISSVLFALVPTRINNYIADLFYNGGKKVCVDSLRRSLIMKLESSCNAISSVSDSVISVSKKLSELNKCDSDMFCRRAVSSVCTHCGLKVFCWDKEREDTKGYINNMVNMLKNKGSIDKQDISEDFITRCCKNNQMLKALNKQYTDYVIRESAERRVNDVRSVLSEQFYSLGQVLEDIVEEFKEYEYFDTAIEEKICMSLRGTGITPREVSCRIDKFQRMFIEVEASIVDKNRINKFTIKKELSKICDRKMDTPCISYSNENCMIQVTERPLFDLQIGASQHICDNGNLCGDNYTYFNDGKGRMIIVMSDGMGTGGRAAIDGAIATGIMSKLSKAGLSFNCALKIINSALLVKSGEESLATLDVICTDLFTGKAEFMKAGAAVTFVKTKGRVISIDTPSLPTGILTDVSFSCENINLCEDDVILMLSDGALSTGENWIKEILKNWAGKDPQMLADKIVNEAIERRNDGHDDDITVLAIKIMEYED